MIKYIKFFFIIIVLIILSGCVTDAIRYSNDEAIKYWEKEGVTVDEISCYNGLIFHNLKTKNNFKEIEINDDQKGICFLMGKDINGDLAIYTYGNDKNTKKLNLNIETKINELNLKNYEFDYYKDINNIGLKYETNYHTYYLDLKDELTIYYVKQTFQVIDGKRSIVNGNPEAINKDEYITLVNYLGQQDFDSLCEQFNLDFITFDFSKYGIIANFETSQDTQPGFIYMILANDNGNEKIIIYPNPLIDEPYVIDPHFTVSFLDSKQSLIDEGKEITNGSLSIDINELDINQYSESIHFAFIDKEGNKYNTNPYD